MAKELTIKEVAELLGISPNDVRLAIAHGDIPSIRIGKKTLIPKRELDEMIKNIHDKLVW